jgi:transcription antitermination protein NusB
MPSRHRSRERALQVLFQIDIHKQPLDDALSSYYGSLYTEEGEEAPEGRDPFMEELVRGAAAATPAIDARVARHSDHWRVERMPVVDRNVIRLAVFEISQGLTPPAVVIDEALDLARRFSGEESVPFINGVLDAIHKEIPDVSTEPESQPD